MVFVEHVEVSSVSQNLSILSQNPSILGQIRVIWGPRTPEQALLFNQNPNVGPLLFTDPTVVLLLLLTIRTVFNP